MKRQLPPTFFNGARERAFFIKPNKIVLPSIPESVFQEHAVRDTKIDFTEADHKYYIDNEYAKLKNPEYIIELPYTSTTTLIKQYFPIFQEDIIISNIVAGQKADSKYYGMSAQEIKDLWSDIREDAKEKGTTMHFYFENILLENKTIMEKLQDDNGWCLNELYKELKIKYPELLEYYIYRPEWRIFDEFNYICGSVDCVLIDKNKTHFIILDWKRSKRIDLSSPRLGSHPITNTLQDCNYIHYSIQLNIYRYIIETRYSVPVQKMFMINLNPTSEKCEIYQIQPMQNIVKAMFIDSKTRKIREHTPSLHLLLQT